MHLSALLTARVSLVLLGFVVTMLVMYALVLRFGPRRGNWNSPAAAFRDPGRAIEVVLLVIAAVNAISGVVLAVALPSGVRLGAFIVCVAMAVFYVAMSQASRIARAAAGVNRRANQAGQ